MVTSCEEKSDVIFTANKECIKNGTYCHHIITDQTEANLTFDVANETQSFTYRVNI